MEHSYCLMPSEDIEMRHYPDNRSRSLPKNINIPRGDFVPSCWATKDISKKRGLSPPKKPQEMEYLFKFRRVDSNNDIRQRPFLLRIVTSYENQENQGNGKGRTLFFESLGRPPLFSDRLLDVSLTKEQKLEGYFWFLDKALDHVQKKASDRPQTSGSISECLAKLDTCWTHALSSIERETLLALAATDSISSSKCKSKLSDDLENVEPMRVESLSQIVAAVLTPAMDAVKSGIPTPDFPNEFCLYSPISSHKATPHPANRCHYTDIHQKETCKSGSHFTESGAESESDEDIFRSKFSFYHYIQEQPILDHFKEE